MGLVQKEQSPGTLKADTIDNTNSGAKRYIQFGTDRKQNVQGFTNQTIETLKRPHGERYREKK